MILILPLIGTVLGDIFTQYYEEAEGIAKAMTFDQLAGQMTQADFGLIHHDHYTDPTLIQKYNLGSLLIGGNGCPNSEGNLAEWGDFKSEIAAYQNANMENWKKFSSKFNNQGIQVKVGNTKYKIKLLLGTDAVHGNQHTSGTVLFPHNVGMAASHNHQNAYNEGYWTGKRVKESGFNFVFAPTVAVSHNPQWGRFYQTMGQNAQQINQMAKQYVRGLQDVKDGKINGVLGSVKHWIGDGATLYGADEGNARIYNWSTFLTHNVQGYLGAIASQIGNVMCSYSGTNGIPNAMHSDQLQGFLREDIGFRGFTISDYDQIGKLAGQYLPTSNLRMTDQEAVVYMVNGGMDMMMLPGYKPNQIDNYKKYMKNGVQSGTISNKRIIQAVSRILAVKLSMGLVVKANSDQDEINAFNLQRYNKKQIQLQDAEQIQASLKAAQQSLILLKNQKLMPVKWSNIQHIVLIGQNVIELNHDKSTTQVFQNYNDIGMMNGGWTLRWQGFLGNYFWQDQNKQKTQAYTMLELLTSIASKNNVILINQIKLHHTQYEDPQNVDKINQQRSTFLNKLKDQKSQFTKSNTLVIGVLGQVPYAEFEGDINIPYCQDKQKYKSGCLHYGFNTYLPQDQKNTLSITYDDFSKQVLTSVRQKQHIPLITVILTYQVLFSGRPMLIQEALDQSQSFIAAWLPATSGGRAVVNAIDGTYKFRSHGAIDPRNTLPVDWPSSMKSLQNFPIYQPDGKIPRFPDAKFLSGFGLST